MKKFLKEYFIEALKFPKGAGKRAAVWFCHDILIVKVLRMFLGINGFLESRNGFQLGNECQKERADLKGRFNKCSIRDDDTGYLEGLSLQADSWTLDRRITKFKYKGLRDRAISHKRHTVKNKQPISSAKFVLLIDHDHPIFRLLH
ncbi:hypothetical protein RclHR1_03200006 [Rhizophagus clarus]|uniref:Uncharacterized protein n=1 Tax=Rhizophagus clarus TaxID=94130 RepID=A0A2Z6S246_9GLOM|nr:hypothetical protein RclHR1_03200006 [Rhizophagus clarus]